MNFQDFSYPTEDELPLLAPEPVEIEWGKKVWIRGQVARVMINGESKRWSSDKKPKAMWAPKRVEWKTYTFHPWHREPINGGLPGKQINSPKTKDTFQHEPDGEHVYFRWRRIPLETTIRGIIVGGVQKKDGYIKKGRDYENGRHGYIGERMFRFVELLVENADLSSKANFMLCLACDIAEITGTEPPPQFVAQPAPPEVPDGYDKWEKAKVITSAQQHVPDPLLPTGIVQNQTYGNNVEIRMQQWQINPQPPVPVGITREEEIFF